MLNITVAMEDAQELGGVLLHVENDGPLCSTETRESGRSRVEAEASVHSQLVSVCTETPLLSYVLFLLRFIL